MNRGGSEAEEYFKKEAGFEAEDVSAIDYLQVHKQEVSFVTISSKQVYTYTEVKDVIFNKVKNIMDMRWKLH